MIDRTLLTAPEGPLYGEVLLPASKSISNRLLIIRALCPETLEIENLSAADDTRLLRDILHQDAFTADCGAGGTTVRFLLALQCLKGREGIITGSERLLQRPISPLIDTLRRMGAVIRYEGKEGFLPVRVGKAELKGGDITIRADVSSQFISALLLIAPCLQEGLSVHLTGEIVSLPYIGMTMALMRYFGAEVEMKGNRIRVLPGKYTARRFSVPADWSAAAFFYAMAALRPGTALTLKNLGDDRFQGDQQLKEFMRDFGVVSTVSGRDVVIKSGGIHGDVFNYDFTNTPDLAQAVTVLAAVSNRKLHLTGLSTLKGKETDRLQALKTELEKAGAQLNITESSVTVLRGIDPQLLPAVTFDTYADHRMVMSLSLLALGGAGVSINEPGHVSKSFPGYFEELEKLGFKTTSL